MDGYIEDQIVNFDLVNSILYFRGDLKIRYKARLLTISSYDQVLQDNAQKLGLTEYNNYKNKIDSTDANPLLAFDDEVVRFNYVIPGYNLRATLFEKLAFIVECQCQADEKLSVSSSKRSKG